MTKNYTFDRIEDRYDPENDINTSTTAAPVTWVEKALYDAVKTLERRVSRLEQTHAPDEPDNGIDSKASAIEMVQSLGLDDAVRMIARSGRNYGRGPNWYVFLEGMNISATFGAGTNSASVYAAGSETILYRAAEYGGFVDIFRNGPWVYRLIDHANELRRANEAARTETDADKAKADAAKFEEVDF